MQSEKRKIKKERGERDRETPMNNSTKREKKWWIYKYVLWESMYACMLKIIFDSMMMDMYACALRLCMYG